MRRALAICLLLFCSCSDEEAPSSAGDACGNGLPTNDEACDDGNTGPGDGCSADCEVEQGWACSGEPSSCVTVCGDGIVAGQETCDDANGDVSDRCPSGTAGSCLPATCGDGFVWSTDSGDEECDHGGGNTNEPCTDCCRTDCTAQTCGDGITDPGEDCDDGNTDPCDGCLPDCTTHTNQCGDGYVCGSEACDAGTANTDAPCVGCCRTDCTAPRCGDGATDPGETCDGDQPCTGLGYYQGTITCAADCSSVDLSACTGYCGDDVRNGSEACDGTDLGSETCAGLGFYTGALACLSDCSALNTSGCAGFCGDGSRNGTELCDTLDLGGATCATNGFYTGDLACNGSCDGYDTAGCAAFCGDGETNGPELCDGSDVGSETCQTQGFYSGDLVCSSGCDALDTSVCSEYCGDGTLNGPEACDGTDHGTDTCADHGFHLGELACDGDCAVDTSGCSLAVIDPFDDETLVDTLTNVVVVAGGVELGVSELYQEDADAYGQTQSAGLNYVSMDYAKPALAASGSWRVRHGLQPTYDIQIPAGCWAREPLELEISSFFDAAANNTSSQPYCFDGSGWLPVGVASSGLDWSGGGAPIANCGTAASFHDGDWEIGSSDMFGSCDSMADLASTTAYGHSFIKEEAMVWNIRIGSGRLTSADLLAGASVTTIQRFACDATLPSGTSMALQLSPDGANWYDASGTAGAWETLASGTQSFDLSSLGWTGPSFYYRVDLGSGTSDTPILEQATVVYR